MIVTIPHIGDRVHNARFKWTIPHEGERMIAYFAFAPFDPGAKWHTYRLEVKDNTMKLSVDGGLAISGEDNHLLPGRTARAPTRGAMSAAVWGFGVAVAAERSVERRRLCSVPRRHETDDTAKHCHD